MEGRETLVRNLKAKAIKRPRCGWEGNIKIDLKEAWCEDLD
jgi:hypothetical protein